MNARLTYLYLLEIFRQASFIISAFQSVKERLETGKPRDEHLWLAVQSILIASANISKILFPVHSKARGRELCRLLKVDQTTVFFDRLVRNHFEHFDERIETWEGNGLENWIDMNVAPSYAFEGAENAAFMRNINPYTLEIYVWDDVFDIKRTKEEAEVLKAITAELLKNLSPPANIFSDSVILWQPDDPSRFGLPSLREKDIARQRLVARKMHKSKQLK
jgi:hypothetical protein